MISQNTIDEVKQRADVADVVKDFVKLKKQGSNLVGLCPFHNEKTGSFTISPAKQIYKCFGCGRSGDAVQFIIDHEQLSYVGAIEWLAAKYGVQIEQEGKKEYVKPQPRLEKVSKEIIEWFENDRKISNDTLLRMKITESREFFPQLKQESPAICFNYFRNEELVNIKYRGKKKSFKLEKDAELIFYNLDALKGEKWGVIVEGEIDVLTHVECGIYNVVGVPNGTAKGHMQLQYLDNSWEAFENLEYVVICVDDDEVGRLLKEELGRRIGKEKCKVVTYPGGCKDSNEILCKLGRESVREMIAGAKDWPLEGIIPMDDMFDNIEYYYEHGYPPGLKSGVPGVDELLSFLPGLNTMATGMPGHGKDEFINDIMVGLAKNEGMVFAIFDFEDDADIHVTKLLEKFTKKAFDFRKNPDERMSRREKDNAIAFVDKHFHFVNVNKIDVTMDGILLKLKELVRRYGVNGVKINPWNYLEHKRNGKSETDYTSEELTKYITFIKQNGVHGFLFAHPTKMQKDKRTGLMEIPTLYHISGSSHFFNKTHNGICVYLDYNTMTTEVHFQKVKYYWHGTKGCARYNFNVNTRQYSLIDVTKLGALTANKSPSPSELGAGAWKPVSEVVPSFYETERSDNLTEDLPF